MDAEALIGSLIRGTLTGRRKNGRRALNFLTGGGNPFLRTSTLLTVAGLAWGAFESISSQTTNSGSAGQWGGSAPGGGQRPPAAPPPPPVSPMLPVPGAGPAPAVDPSVLRIIRLIISAARADGNLSDSEKNVIVAHAGRAGAESVVLTELSEAHPLSKIVEGVTDPRVREDLYTLAFTIVHADQGVTGAERIYLAQLANYLDLEPDTVTQLEAAATGSISIQSVS